jgi:hypothetical protein
MTQPDFPDWTEARSIASEIAEFGAPLLRLTRNLGFNNAGLTLPANAETNLFLTAAIDQPGYEAQLSLIAAANGITRPWAQVIVTWGESASGQVVATDFFIIPCGAFGIGSLTCYLSGPCKGDRVQIAVVNSDPSVDMTLTFTCNVNSHIYTWDRMFQSQLGILAGGGFNYSGGFPATGMLAGVSPSINPASYFTSLLPVYNGKCRLTVYNGFGTAGLDVTLQDPASLYSGVNQAPIFLGIVASGGSLNEEIILPNGPIELVVYNQSATDVLNPTITLIKEEY